MKRAVILFAEGYETVEALLVVDLLRRGGVEVTMASITEDEFVSKINAAFPDLSIDKIDLKIISFTDAGRVSTVKIGEKSIKATALRKALDLRSTDFTFRIADGKIIFTQRGYGHGVGMSQHGAQALALSGKTYSEILLHYYTGCKIEKR